MDRKMIISAYVKDGYTTVEIKYNGYYSIKAGECKKGLPWRLILKCITEIFLNKRARIERAQFHNITDR